MATLTDIQNIAATLDEFYVGGVHLAPATGDLRFFFASGMGVFLVTKTGDPATLQGNMVLMTDLTTVPAKSWEEFVEQVKVALSVRKTDVANKETARDNFIATLA